MNIYRIKHIPTGLYYKPKGINLTKKGKIYNTNINVLSHYKDIVHISTKNNKLLYNKLKGMFYKEGYIEGNFLIPVKEFELEYITKDDIK